MSWTDERIATLRDLWEQGLSASQIAAKLGNITRNAVIGKVHRLGLSGRPSPVRTERAAQAPAAAPAAPVAAAPAAPAAQAPARPAESQPRILPAGPAPAPAAARPVRLVTTTTADVAAQAAQKPRVLPASPAPAPREAAPRAAAPAPEPEPMVRATLLSINDRMCKWPVGDPGEAGFHFCGRRAQTGMPYCQDHARIAYQAATPKAREKRDRDRERERERLLRSLS
ncbi:GcrA family cell cycle regulator [Zavarzinia compransoris]|uniref:GcrA cell cycle regulator n=1 Tax=Zavarzinia compransoris TaxID=1264899 RepID=A0A317DW36_9PROT|nr:GcrA family cell cycle regulator [Zavarzinia compransoris]PWR18899.1 GcrA cell cycle regulator [Zavarzinia compransoris]TDP48895.1 GcrA cell cycle regulator [Zavarzinia compransoris]